MKIYSTETDGNNSRPNVRLFLYSRKNIFVHNEKFLYKAVKNHAYL